MFVRNLSQPFNVRDIASRVADALAINRAGVLVDELVYIFRTIAGCKLGADTALRENMRQQGVSCAVELRQRNDVVALLGDVDERVFDGGHSRTDAERLHSTFERGDALLQNRVRRVANAGIDVAFDFEIEQRGAVFCAVELEGNRLVNGHGDRFGGGIAVVARVNGDGFSLHASTEARAAISWGTTKFREFCAEFIISWC